MPQSLPCLRNTIITGLLKNQVVKAMIHSFAPKGLSEDFEQEVYLLLLEMPADRIVELERSGFLIGYFIKLIKNVGADRRIFNKNYFDKDVTDYLRHCENMTKKGVDGTRLSVFYNSFESWKQGSKNEKHDYLIMTKYIELKSCRKVADYFNVPLYHVQLTIDRIKKELKKDFKNGL
jgi:hypothetical protein